MKNLFIYSLVLFSIVFFSSASNAEELKKEKTFKVNDKGFNMVTTTTTTKTTTTSVTPNADGTIMVSVKNEFDDEIKVKFDTNREYPIRPNEWISLGDRKPGKYTLTIYNKKGDFVDNLSLDISKKNKYTLNKNTVSDSGKITGLSTGQKVAIGAGAVGVAALGAALIGKAIMSGDDTTQAQYIPPAPAQQVVQAPAAQQQVVGEIQKVDPNNAFAIGGKAIKVLNTAYDKVTFIVEGSDGNLVGSNWDIPKGTAFKKPAPLIYNGQNILINQNQKIKAVLPSGAELQRYAFELEKDPFDGTYIWVVK